MRYENQNDRANQTVVAKALEEHLSSMPIGQVEVRETPKSRAASHDLDVYVSGMYVGVAEVKCRNYPTEFFRKQGWAIEADRLNRLKNQFCTPHATAGAKSVSLVLCTSDLDVFIISIQSIYKNGKNLRVVEENFATDDHGAIPVKKKMVIIPLDLMFQLSRGTV